MSKAQSSSKTAPKNISVYLRVRPPVSREKNHTFENIQYDPSNPGRVTLTRKSGTKLTNKSYAFNRVFQPKATQQEVYTHFAKNAVEAAFDGQHGVLFVYGQTGSGKTFTISNEDPKNLGVLQQAMEEIWGKIAADKNNDYTCSVSYVQLYNEILTDLLDPQKGRVRIQMGNEGRGDVVLVTESAGTPIEKRVNNYTETMQMFNIGMSRKEMQSTSMNMTSSRSHTVFTLNISKATKVKAVCVSDGTMEAAPTVALEGRLVLCDLAGSERVSKTHAEGKTLDEATHINSSLLVLGKVVAALTDKNSQHAPFRESKLTRILQYPLLGNGNTSIVVNVSPSDDNTEESASAIGFGQRAIQIKQDAQRHEVLDYKALYLQLMAELDAKNDKTLEGALEEERVVYEDRVASLEEQLRVLRQENSVLQKENDALRAGLPPDKLALLNSGGSGDGEWKAVNNNLKDMVTARDSKIKTISDERVKLALLLAEEKRTAFLLAQKLRAIMMRYQLDRNDLIKRVDHLGAELAATKGTDYLSAVGPVDSTMIPMPGNGSHVDPASPVTPRMDRGDAFMNEDLEKAQAAIRALRAERIELIVYQSKAQKAIRLLYAEKEAALRGA